MPVTERDELLELADLYQQRARDGQVPDAVALAGPVEAGEPRRFLEHSMHALRGVLRDLLPSISKEKA
jgi:hypothetical protein